MTLLVKNMMQHIAESQRKGNGSDEDQVKISAAELVDEHVSMN